MSEEESKPENLEYSLSLPDFQFVEFAGLDGFDRRSCMWLPQSDSESSITGDSCRVKSIITPCNIPKANEENIEYSSLKKHLRKNNVGHSNNNGFGREKSNIQLPVICHGSCLNANKRGCPGQLVYESPRNACKEDIGTKFDKIKAFGGARNSSHKLHTGAFAKEHGAVPVIPWKGRSFPRISSSVHSHREDIMGKNSLVKKCGGGGYATGVGRTIMSSFVSQSKFSPARKSRSGEPRAPLRRFRF
ncbi:unnamed protein product [Allacma fusca]|uniref:Uncharacterized protein n=1 Tax=Allacma fusca TaxID=39272 RepID=A0A8J2P801_9HEXA|nr:unnamed protein product [Allacma fusca]